MAAGGAEDEFFEGAVAYYLVAALFPILLLFGTLGNMLTYNILHRTTLGDRSSAIFLFKSLAFLCILTLWLALPRHWLRTVYGEDIRKAHFIICTLHKFSLYSVMDIAAWVMAAISADRLITVYFPSRSSQWCTVRNAKLALTGLTLYFVGCNLRIFFVFGRKYADDEDAHSTGTAASQQSTSRSQIVSECAVITKNQALLFFSNEIHPYTSFAHYVIGPFFVMLISAILIARKLRENRALVEKCKNEPDAYLVLQQRKKARQQQAGVVGDGEPKTATSPECHGDEEQVGEQLLESGQQSTDAGVQAHGGDQNKATVISSPIVAETDQASFERLQTRLTLAATIEFVLTATPSFCLDISENVIKSSDYFQSPRGKAQFKMLYTSVRLLLFSNFALHFFLFCFTVPRFRREFKKLVKLWQSFIMIEQPPPRQQQQQQQQQQRPWSPPPPPPPAQQQQQQQQQQQIVEAEFSF